MSDDFTGADFAPSADSGGGETAVATVEPTAQPGAATTEPAVSATEQTATSEPARPAGPIPFDVHKTALENARVKATAEWEQQYGWAKELNRDEVQTLVQFRQALAADPTGTLLRELAAISESQPEAKAQLQTWAAQQLNAARRPAQPTAEPSLPVIQLEDGRTIDLNALREQIQRDTLAAAQAQFKPAMDAAQRLQQAEATVAAQREAHTFATGIMPELTALPQFKEHAAEIKAALANTKLQTDHPAEVSAAVYRIYNRIVLPKLQTAERRTVLQDLTHKANAGSVNPAQTGTRAPKSIEDMTLAEALQHAHQQGA